jgi:eukaryotic-like serine/threonine-protein kinase
MVCSRCGLEIGVNSASCRCGSAAGPIAVATDVIPAATTGRLPPDATFGRSVRAVAAATSSETIAAASAGAHRAATAPMPPEQIFAPRYHIIRLLGVGGMGAVYQAWDSELNVAVALKVIRTDTRRGPVSREAERQFKNELLLARQVTHRNVVRIHDLGAVNGVKYISMPYVEGHDLATLLRRHGTVPVARALHIARQIAGGLQAAHEAGVVHRDLKPANIMITADDHALIMDFGISASAANASVGSLAGTFEYMAPEQGGGDTVDARADIYAFGLILYEMLTGPRQLSAGGPVDRLVQMKARVESGLTPIRQLDGSVAEALAALVMRCLERDPAARPSSSAELVAALDALDDAGELRPLPARLSRRTMMSVAIVALVVAAGTYFAGRRSVPQQPAAHPMIQVLVTDFDNASGDAAFDGPIGQEALSIALEGAPFVELYPAADARAQAALQSQDHSNRLTREAGRLIARRDAIKVLVEGSIDKQSGGGPGYRVTVRAVDPVNDAILVSSNEDASRAADVLLAIEKLARRVRVALGESKTEMDRVAAAETFTAGTLDAMRAYARAQDLASSGRIPEALAAYQQAITDDPQFGRAYSGMATIYRNLGQMDRAQATFDEALTHVGRMTEREKYRTLGAYYLSISGNYQKSVDVHQELVNKFPADQAGLSNLAFSYAMLRDFANAVRVSRMLVELYPNYLLGRNNYAIYSLYAGNFDEAITQIDHVLRQNPNYQFAFLPLALAQLSKGNLNAGLDTYARLERLNPFGASLGKLAAADASMYQGKYTEAVTLLAGGVAEDERAGNKRAVALKSVAAAVANAALNHNDSAIAAARKAASLGTDEVVLFPAAVTFIRARRDVEARTIADTLAAMLEDAPRSYARLIDAVLLERNGRVLEAIDIVREAQKRHDSWWSRLLLGRLHEEAVPPHHSEALQQLELALKRRGEAADAFIADTPTLRDVPPVYYWLARAQEGVDDVSAARRSYDEFLALLGHTDATDPLVADARKRVAALPR